MRSIVTFLRRVERARKFTAGRNSSPAHDGTVFVLTELDDLVTGQVLSVSPVPGACAVATLAMLFMMRALHARARVLLWAPITVAEVVSVARHPCVHTFGVRVVLGVPMRALLILTVQCHGWSLGHLFAFSMILDNLPVLLNRYVDIAELDLPLLSLLDLSQFLPLN